MSEAAVAKPVDQPEMLEKHVQELTDIELVDGKRSKEGLLLRPQPSNDPNDPLVCVYSRYPTNTILTRR